jgi:hypothetical protein
MPYFVDDGASHDNSDAEIPLTQSDEEVEERPRQKRKSTQRILSIREDVPHWVTGDKATQPEEDVEREIFENAIRLMHLSGLKKLPGHKVLDTDLYLWKKAGAHSSPGINYVPYRCPLLQV